MSLDHGGESRKEGIAGSALHNFIINTNVPKKESSINCLEEDHGVYLLFEQEFATQKSDHQPLIFEKG
jgi:hypothetical protein